MKKTKRININDYADEEKIDIYNMFMDMARDAMLEEIKEREQEESKWILKGNCMVCGKETEYEQIFCTPECQKEWRKEHKIQRS